MFCTIMLNRIVGNVTSNFIILIQLNLWEVASLTFTESNNSSKYGFYTRSSYNFLLHTFVYVKVTSYKCEVSRCWISIIVVAYAFMYLKIHVTFMCFFTWIVHELTNHIKSISWID